MMKIVVGKLQRILVLGEWVILFPLCTAISEGSDK
jgi:hypothetical protein